MPAPRSSLRSKQFLSVLLLLLVFTLSSPLLPTAVSSLIAPVSSSSLSSSAWAAVLSRPAHPTLKVVGEQLGYSGTGACTRRQGRAVLFRIPKEGLAFSHFGIFVSSYEKYYGQADLLSVFRLSLYPAWLGEEKSLPLLSRQPPSLVSLISGRMGEAPKYEVLFDLGERREFLPWTKITLLLECDYDGPPRRYSLLETADYHQGYYVLYDSSQSRIIRRDPRLADVGLSYVLYAPRSETIKPPPQFHPVVFIHGLGGRPADWRDDQRNQNYQKILLDLGYPPSYIHLYSYGYREGRYDYEGDVRRIAAHLEEVVQTLSRRHREDGGDGRVDLVGYSLGGLIARHYLSTHYSNHKVRKLITIGTPHKGSWVMGVDRGISKFPLIGRSAEKALAGSILTWLNKGRERPISRESFAALQVVPGSDLLDGPEGINRRTPQNLKYYTFYGDIHAELNRRLFSWVVRKKISIGDGLVLPNSATFIPGGGNEKYAYSEEIALNLVMKNLGNAYALTINLPSIKSLRAVHTNLLGRDDLKRSLVCDTLGNKGGVCE